MSCLRYFKYLGEYKRRSLLLAAKKIRLSENANIERITVYPPPLLYHRFKKNAQELKTS